MWHDLVSEECIAELPPAAKRIFMRFYNVAAGSITHPQDHRRFNEFIRHCHAKRVKLTEGQFKRMLLRIGCAQYQATKLGDIYYYGRELLKHS